MDLTVTQLLRLKPGDLVHLATGNDCVPGVVSSPPRTFPSRPGEAWVTVVLPTGAAREASTQNLDLWHLSVACPLNFRYECLICNQIVTPTIENVCPRCGADDFGAAE